MSEPLTHLEQYALDLHEEVLRKAGDNSRQELCEDALTELILEHLSEHNEASGAEICHYSKTGRGKIPAAKLNGWALSGDAATLDVFVTHYCGTGKLEAVPRSEVAECFKLLRGFLRRAREGFHTELDESDPGFEPARCIHQATDTLTSARLFVLTDGIVKSSDIDQEGLPGLELTYVLWDLEKLSRLHVGHREVIELDFKRDYGGAVPCLERQDVTGEYRTYLGYLPAPLLAKIYGKHGQRLLERNVRAFLQAKGKVNRGLQQTIREEPNRFLAYNNGLCCTAAEVKLQPDADGHTLLEWVRDIQIVNGGQTTASIYHALRKEKTDISQVVVQIKLTVLSQPEKVAEIVPLISKYANSQNKVNAADFSANGRFHHQLEQLSRTVWTPPTTGMGRGTHWYYERARGSYADDKASQGPPGKIRSWVQDNPPDRKFTKTDLAKYEQTWLGFPHLVCRGAEKCFLAFAERLEDDGEPEVNQGYYHQIVARTILFRTAEKLFSTLGLEGYRANAVSYALAWLAAKSHHRINLPRIWEDQAVPPATQEAIKIACKAAHAHLAETQGNVGEWSKRPECWDKFRQKEIPLDSAWERDWAETQFLNVSTTLQALAQKWESVRHHFANDTRTLAELEALTGRTWFAARRKDEARTYAARPWEQLRGTGGRRLKNLGDLVEIFAAAVPKAAMPAAP